MNRLFNGLHIAATRKVEVFIKQITMAILFGRPSSRPADPAVGTREISFLVNHQVKIGLIAWKSFFRYHVADQGGNDCIGDTIGAFT